MEGNARIDKSGEKPPDLDGKLVYVPQMLYFCRNHQYGQAPSKVIAKVSEWIDLHEAEILTLWERAQRGEALYRIEPLK